MASRGRPSPALVIRRPLDLQFIQQQCHFRPSEAEVIGSRVSEQEAAAELDSISDGRAVSLSPLKMLLEAHPVFLLRLLCLSVCVLL